MPAGLVEELPYVSPDTVTILPTYRCTAACKDCCFDSNPHVKGRLELAEIIQFIAEASALGTVKTVVFSGGECFLLGSDLTAAIRECADRGLRTRCVTNGYWAKSIQRGHERLSELRSAGLCELNISTGDFHQEYVDEETVLNAASLGISLGLDATVVCVELRDTRSVTASRLLSSPRLQDLMIAAGPERFRLIESPWMPMDADRTILQPAGRMLDRTNLHQKRGCRSVLRTIVLTPSARLGSCCGLSRERIPELNDEWVAGELAELVATMCRDFMKIWLAVDGPERILAWAASKDKQIEWEGRYSHPCHACLAIFASPLVREVILDHYKERVDDVLLRFTARSQRRRLLEGQVYA